MATWAFAGSFRKHELLATGTKEFDTVTTLMNSDVRLTKTTLEGKEVEVLMVRLKLPKESKGNSVTVEMFKNDSMWCPVKAFKSWKKTSRLDKKASSVMLRKEDGSCLAWREFNTALKVLLVGYTGLQRGHFSSHSFRAGMASMMAKAGYTDEDIQRQ